MKIIVVGCGRVGASLAEAYDRAGHEVIVVDISTAAFDRLPSGFGGNAIRGDGTDEDVLRRAGAEGADVFLALTEGDNRNVMSAQLANEALGARRVIAKINDPVRAKAYAELGIATLCRTGLMMDAVDRFLGFPKTDMPGMLAPTGHHDGPAHTPASAASGGATGGPAGTSAAPALPGPATLTPAGAIGHGGASATQEV